MQKKKNSNKKIRIKFDRKKKPHSGWNYKKKTKKWSQTKQITIKKWWLNLKDKKIEEDKVEKYL